MSMPSSFHRFALIATLCFAALSAGADDHDTTAGVTPTVTENGFMDLAWRQEDGELWMAIDDLDRPVIYQGSLARGVGSNDIGLDRGQLGATRLVRFERVGPRVLMIEENLRYRADSDDPAERRAVAHSFARSVLWGFDIKDTADGRLWVDMTGFALRDAHGLAATLRAQGHGSFSPDSSRSSIYPPRTRAFPDNTEIEAIVTFTGEPDGRLLASVVPDPTAITVHLHHSFVRLPDDGYTPLAFAPRSGFLDTGYAGSFYDYASAIDQPLERAFVRRHRLQKKTPGDAPSDVVEPIVYYVDPGAPEPVRAALIDGATWWRDAFTAAGFLNAFEVRLLPDGADPMDVRYNVIQWVHRSTRGWSYGASVIDPRTGEILKGHVTLGSLRVRQDRLLAEGLLSPFGKDDDGAERASAMALARIRQLSAHEVGHTLGLEHNFAGSTDNRSSVMDYPFPKIDLVAGEIRLDDAYAVGIGLWDRRAIGWGYGDFSSHDDPAAARRAYLNATYKMGLSFVADRHARRAGDAHPDGNLWDNGADAIDELTHLMAVRRVALGNMGRASIPTSQPPATIEDALVPIYLLHRYQLQAVGKLIAGQYFDYAPAGALDGPAVRPVEESRQRAALDALLSTLTPRELAVPPSLMSYLAPRPPGFPDTRELFDHPTGFTFDRAAPPAALTELCLDVLLDPTRAARLTRANYENALDFHDLLETLVASTLRANRSRNNDALLQQTVNFAVIRRLIGLLHNGDADPAVRAAVRFVLTEVERENDAGRYPEPSVSWQAHDQWIGALIKQALSTNVEMPSPVAPTVPPGSPIGQ
ncbi:MAG: zinc-dependent metalloprotease [Pseudomonadota bacterium]